MVRTCHEKFSSSKAVEVFAEVKLGLDFDYTILGLEN
jgi:hypothetical protein